MDKRFRNMKIEEIDLYTELFIEVFNGEPWNDSWSKDTAEKRIRELMDVPTFEGLTLWDDDKLVGVIFGRREQYYDGIHFQIQEFYIDNKVHGQGYGTLLIKEFEKRLKEKGIDEIHLLTLRDMMTEGFYNKKGYSTSDELCWMFKKI